MGAPARIARCTASRCVGEGGRGAGFIACATVSGMVGRLADEMTGPAFQVISMICVQSGGQHTSVIPVNGSLHKRLHPITDHSMLIRGKRMWLVRIVDDPESVSSGADRIIRNDFISPNIDISLHFGFLFTSIRLSFPRARNQKREGDQPSSSASNRDAVP